MKIAIISYDALPDARIEKYIHSLKMIYPDANLYFIGTTKRSYLALIPPNLFKHIPLSKSLRFYTPYPALDMIVSWKITKLVKRIDPDLLVGINIHGGSVASIISKKLRIPLLIDYHEIYAIQLKWFRLKGRKLVTHVLKKKYWTKLEEELLGNHVATVTSEPIRKYFREKTGNNTLYVVKNYPSSIEIPRRVSSLKCSKILFVNIGIELLMKSVGIYRDSRLALPFIEKVYMEKPVFEILVLGWKGRYKNFVRGLGWIRHMEMYEYLTRCHYGMFLSYPCEPHHYNNPNRPYIYAAAGCIPIITGDWKTVIDDLGQYSIIVDPGDYPENIYSVIRDALDTDCDTINEIRSSINSYVRKNFYWELQNPVIKKAVEKALS